MGQEEDPICIFLVISGSRGQKMLFRYPFQDSGGSYEDSVIPKLRVKVVAEDLYQNPYQLKATDQLCDRSSMRQLLFNNCTLYGFSDSELASLMAPKSILCNQKFDLKIDFVKLIGYPVKVLADESCGRFQDLLEIPNNERTDDVMISMVNVVIAIHANVDARVGLHYQNVCMMLGKALRHEEKRYEIIEIPLIHRIIAAFFQTPLSPRRGVFFWTTCILLII